VEVIHNSQSKPKFLSIVYVSSATRLLRGDELVELLKVSQRNNERVGITGLLLYKDGNFMQVIEGPSEAVRTLYERIKQDSLNTGVYTLMERSIREREFPDWTMAFQNVAELPAEALAGFSSFLTDTFTADSFRRNPGRAHKLLLMFRDNMR